MKGIFNNMATKINQNVMGNNFTSTKDKFAEKFKMAEILSTSSLMPVVFKNKVADVVMMMELSEQMNVSLPTVAQNLDLAYGKVGWKSTFVIAMINKSDRFKSTLNFEWKGTEGDEDWSCRAHALKKDGTNAYGTWISIKMAKEEEWISRAGSKWQTMPEQMLQYRAASFFGRIYIPDLLSGFQTVEEIVDFIPIVENQVPEKNDTPALSVEEAVGKVEIIELKPKDQPDIKEKINAQPEVSTDINDSAFKSISELKLHVETLGFNFTEPTKGGKKFWVKAVRADEYADVEELLKSGFTAKENFFYMNVTNLVGA